LATDSERICDHVRSRFGFLTALSDDERQLLDDQVAHREHRLFKALRDKARVTAKTAVR
jgi:hypothetical protein